LKKLDEIKLFEKSCDEEIANLSLWKKPLRSILTAYIMMADSMVFGGRFGRQIERDQYKAERILARLSYLAPHLNNCSRELLRNGREAIEKFGEKDKPELQEALMYAHFCEIMPAFRQDYYDVDLQEEDFHFSYKSDDFAKSEVKDVLLTELCLGLNTKKPEEIPAAIFSGISLQYPHKDLSAYIKGAAINYDLHCSSFSEPTYIPDGAFFASFGFSQDAFQKIRGALWSLSDLLLGLSAFYEELARYNDNRAMWEWRVVDCIAPTFKRSWLVSFLSRLTGVSSAKIIKVLDFLVASEQNEMFDRSGNGYLQPLVQLGEFIFTSPLLLRMMPSMRNMLYTLNKSDADHFSRAVAHHLEVELLKEVSDLCDKIPGLLFIGNVQWSHEGREGELDAILYDSDRRFILALQAKAAIPPEGARMTRNVEARTLEAVDQVTSFEKLSRKSKERILSGAIGNVSDDFFVSHGIVTRSGLGTNKAWKATEGISVFNVGLLSYALVGSDKTSLDFLSDPETFLAEVIDDLVRHHFISWEVGIIPLNHRGLHIPLMKLDHDALQKLRVRISEN
jgi:hypothetical protein